MRQISLVGAVDEEVGDYFPEFLDMLEESPFLKVGGRFFIYLYIYIFHWTIFTHALTHSHTQDVYSFRPETGCVLTRVAAGIMFFCSDCTAHPQPERPPLHLGRGIA